MCHHPSFLTQHMVQSMKMLKLPSTTGFCYGGPGNNFHTHTLYTVTGIFLVQLRKLVYSSTVDAT